MQGRTVGVTEAGIQHAGGGDDPETGRNGVSRHGMPRAKQMLRLAATFQKPDRVRDVTQQLRQSIGALQNARGQRSRGVRRALQPNGF